MVAVRRTPPADHPVPETSSVTEIASASASVLGDDEPSLSGKAEVGIPEGPLPTLPPPPVDESSGRLSPLGVPDSRRGVSRIVLTRTLKSSILIVKVHSLLYSTFWKEYSFWRQVLSLAGVHSTSKLSLALKSIALATAVVDTWFDSLKVSATLGLFHAGLLYIMD